MRDRIIAFVLLLAACPADAATYTAVRAGSWSNLAAGVTPWASGTTVYPWQKQSIAGIADNGSGKLRIALASAVTPAWVSGDKAYFSGLTGVSATIPQTATLVDSTHLDFAAVNYYGVTYNSGATVSRNDTITSSYSLDADVSVTGGSDTGGIAAITQNSGTLTIKSGVTVSVRDYLTIPAILQLEGGSILEIGATGIGGSINVVTTGQVRTSGTSAGNRATIRRTAGALGWIFYGMATVNLSYADLINAGFASTYTYVFNLSANRGLAFDHVTFDGCYPLNPPGNRYYPSATDVFSFTNCTWKNSVGAASMYLGCNANRTTGTRTLSHCYFDVSPNVTSGLGDFTVDDNIFNTTLTITAPTYKAASCQRNLFRTAVNTYLGYLAPGDLVDCYHLITEASPNAFFVQPASAYSTTVLRNTFDAPFLLASVGNVADCFYSYDSTTPGIVHRISYSISLPVAVGSASDNPPYNGKGITSGMIQSGATLPSGNVKIRIDHNTECARTRAQNGTLIAWGARCGPLLNEGATSPAAMSAPGTIDWHRDNLFWDDAGTSSGNYGYASYDGTSFGYGPDNCLVPANCRNNAYYKMATATGWTGKTNNGTYYASPTTGVVPGIGDVTLASPPNFVDPTRSFLTWGRWALGLTGRTDAQAPADVEATIAAMAKMNDDTGFNPACTVNALNAWVRAGWAPRNPSLKAKASDGTTPGAVDAVSDNFLPWDWPTRLGNQSARPKDQPPSRARQASAVRRAELARRGRGTVRYSARAAIESGRTGELLWWQVGDARIEMEATSEGWAVSAWCADWGGIPLDMRDLFVDEFDGMAWCEGMALILSRGLGEMGRNRGAMGY